MTRPEPSEVAEPASPVSVSNSRRVYIKSFGCQMNVYDAQRMADVTAAEGYSETQALDDADLVVLNTCHIRERASEKIYSELGMIREMKEDRAAVGKDTTIVVAGCVAQAEGREIVRRQKAVDLVVGPQNYHRLPELLARARAGGSVVDTDFPIEDKFDHLPAPSRESVRARGVAAYVTAQEGCDKFCSFCVVPYTRGSETSRPLIKVLDEMRDLAAAGAREFTILGQNVNAYHGATAEGGSATLADLLAAAARIPGVLRLRYATSHPLDMQDDLIRAHAEIEALAPYLHLPIQSGSDRILAAMNRRHTVADYLAIVERVRRVRPDIAFSSDFIVGFPGETDKDFEATMEIVREVNFASAFAFKYSSRPGTPAASGAARIAAPGVQSRDGRSALRGHLRQTRTSSRPVGRKVALHAGRPRLCRRKRGGAVDRSGHYRRQSQLAGGASRRAFVMKGERNRQEIPLTGRARI